MNVIGYVRVSTQDQATSGLGLSAQRISIEREALHRGWELLGIHEDAGASGSNLARSGLTTALEELAAGEAAALVVAKLDRATRSVVDFGALLETAARQGWAFVALDLGVDTTTATGELVANVMMSVAQWERRTIGERTSAALAAKKAQGVRLGRPRTTPDTVLREVVRLRAEGYTIRAIADELNRRRIPTPRGGKRWWTSTVRGLLRSAELDEEVRTA